MGIDFLKGFFVNPDYKAFAAKHTNKYDIVVTINSLLDLKTGWKVNYPLYEMFTKNKNLPSEAIVVSRGDTLKNNSGAKRAVVSILGLYNRGKSYVLARIFGLTLSSSYFEHTEGLSIVTSRSDMSDVLIGLDTKGSQKPVKNGDEGLIKDSEATERFLQTLSLKLSDVVLIIVNRLTRDDQSYIRQVKSTFVKNANIIVVHNLSHVNTIEQLDRIIKEEVVDCFQCIKQQVKGESPYWSASDGTRHVVLAKDEIKPDNETKSLPYDKNAGLVYNEKTIKLLRNWLTACASTSHDRTDLVQDIVAYTNSVINNYLVRVKPALSDSTGEKSPLSSSSNNNSDSSNSSISDQKSPMGNSAQPMKVVIDHTLTKVDECDDKFTADEEISIKFDTEIPEKLTYADIRFNMVGIISNNFGGTAIIQEDLKYYYIDLDCTGFEVKDLRFKFENAENSVRLKVTSNRDRQFPFHGENINVLRNDFQQHQVVSVNFSYLFPGPIVQRSSGDLKRDQCVSLNKGVLQIKIEKDQTVDDGVVD